MNAKTAIVVTSISAPNRILKDLATGAKKFGHRFIVIGDRKSPDHFELEGCEFHSLASQAKMDFEFSRLCPERHYARKNIGYLLAYQGGAEWIVETDDDNIPYEEFWEPRPTRGSVAVVTDSRWVNVYRYFTDDLIWPRGLPLDRVQDLVPPYEALTQREVSFPIQQGLADANPDVDAVYRLIYPLPRSFRKGPGVALGEGAWCPFNSQNTSWMREAFPLLYLPSYCSFRMTDIWRSFVAQRIAWTNGWHILFHQATVTQERNEHNLMNDFKDEIPGYLGNAAIRDALSGLSLKPGVSQMMPNLRLCYEKLVELEFVDAKELGLVDAWIADFKRL